MKRAAIRGTFLVIVGAASAAGGEASAQALPSGKIADVCAKESAPGQCAAFEGIALKSVSASWPFVLEQVKQACLSQVKVPVDQSWRLLAECIDGETRKALDRRAVHTARTPSAELIPPPRPPAPPPAPEFANPPATELPKPQQ
jgi:hypothetical protein